MKMIEKMFKTFKSGDLKFDQRSNCTFNLEVNGGVINSLFVMIKKI